MSQSPVSADVEEKVVKEYIDAWEPLNQRLLTGSSFSGRERNCCFLNTRGTPFADVSAVSGLNQIDDGRSIALTDWDQDGDLDLWIVNRTSPRIRFLRNDVPTENSFAAFALTGDPAARCPRDAFGARLELTLIDSDGSRTQRIQTLYGGDGFLSQSSRWVHFGIGADEKIESVAVRWPGTKEAELFKGVAVGQRWNLTQGKGVAEAAKNRAEQPSLTPSEIEPLPLSKTGRLKLSWLKELDDVVFEDFEGRAVKKKRPFQKPQLYTLWASWCSACREELSELARASLGDLDIIALNVESATGESGPSVAAMNQILDEIGFEGERGIASQALISMLNDRHLDSIYVRYELPLPVSFLVDEEGMLRVVYKGRLDVEQLKKDVATLDAIGRDSMALAMPFPGRWSEEVLNGDPVQVAKVHIENGNPKDAREFLEWYLENYEPPEETRNDSVVQSQRIQYGALYYQLGRVAYFEKDMQTAFEHSKTALRYNPNSVEAMLAIVSHLSASGDYEEAKPYIRSALELAGGNARVEYQAGVVASGLGSPAAAIKHYQTALAANPKMIAAANNLAWILATCPDRDNRDGRQAVQVAKGVCEATGFRDYRLFDTLAAAYAETGDFDSAIKLIDRSLQMATAKGDGEMAELFKERRILFQASKPVRD